jgi:hypothetical protein
MAASSTPLTRWLHRPRRRSWLTDTRDPEYAVGRLINGARPGRGA